MVQRISRKNNLQFLKNNEGEEIVKIKLVRRLEIPRFHAIIAGKTLISKR